MRSDADNSEGVADGIRLPRGFTMHATPSELRIRARLGYETVEPTLMSYLMLWVLVFLGVVMGLAALDHDFPKWFDKFFCIYGGVFGLFALVANFLNRVHLRVDAGGITTGIRPVPVSGFSFRRRILRDEIAGIYVSQCDLWVRSWIRLTRSFEVHALTTQGEPVRLLQRILEASVAADLAVEIRKRLGVLPRAHVPLRGRMRSASDIALRIAGIFPAWSFWLGLFLIGLEPLGFPLLGVAGRDRVTAKVTSVRGLHEGRRYCTVRFDTPGGPVSARVENRCSSGTNIGDRLTVFYRSRDPSSVRILTLQLWPISLMFCAVGGAALFFVRERAKFLGGSRILWQDKFRYPSPFWHLRPKESGVAKGTLAVWGLSGSQVLPHTDQAFDPGVVEVRIETAERAGDSEGAGVLFGLSYDGIGYVFCIHPHLQTAFARRIGRDWSFDRMPVAYVPEIKPEPGAWNTLRVEIDGDWAKFFVNGARAGVIDYEPAIGGGMVGLYADFGDGRNVWRFSGLTVLA